MKIPILLRAKIIPWGIGILAVIGVTSCNQPDQDALQRQKECQSWGITDSQVLAKCRQSTEQKDAAIEPILRPKIEREIAEFNRRLSTLAETKTVAKGTDYPSARIEDVAKITGGELNSFRPPNDSRPFTAKGRRFKLAGIIVSQQPDPDDPPDERQSEPRYFTLETETPPPSFTGHHVVEDQAYLKWSIERAVNLDIESLNRYERQFIIDHCNFLISVAERVPRTFNSVSGHGCRATVLGYIDEVAGGPVSGVTYVGIIADQVDLQPLDFNTAKGGPEVSPINTDTPR